MSRQLPARSSGPHAFGFLPGEEDVVPPRLARRISRTIMLGVVISVLFVVGLGVWAAVSPVAGAVPAAGVVKVENNRKTIKHLEPGVLQRILVHDGDHVRAGQVMFELDPTQAKALVDTLAASEASLIAERARFEAEARGAASVVFPPELLAQRNDPMVAAAIASQQALFDARRAAMQSQVDVGQQRVAELGSQIDGLQAQVASTNSQLGYNTDELGGVQQLYKGGYAPKTRLLALQRQDAGLKGQRGDQQASIARARQAIGETRLQVLSTRQARTAEAAAGLEAVQDKLADIGPKLVAAREQLGHTEVRSPVDGYVLNLTQFTEGAAVNSGEVLAEVVPSNAPLVIQVEVRPQDVHYIRPGQRALITMSAYNSRTTPRIEAEVVNIAADQTLPQTAGAVAQGVPARTPYFLVDMRIPPDQLKRLPPSVKLYPGLPVSTSIVTGQRSIMDYLLGPMKESLGGSLHEE